MVLFPVVSAPMCTNSCYSLVLYKSLTFWRLSAILDFHIFAFFLNSNLYLFLRCHAKFSEDRTIHSRVIAYFRFSKCWPTTILDFYNFATFVKNSNLCLVLRRLAKFGEHRTICGRVIAYYPFSKWRPSAILDLV